MDDVTVQGKAGVQTQNDDVQQIIYSISHDMGAPLRAIVQFSELIRQRLDGRLSEKEAYWLELIQSSGEDAQNMIDALLIYSRLSTHRKPDTDVCLAGLVESAALELTAATTLEETPVNVLTELPELYGCAGHWQTLVSSLLSNALLYHPKTPDHTPQVNVSFERDERGARFIVEDNGIGVSEAAWSVITNPFKQLRAPDYKGTGMGLAYCKRIAELQGGQLAFGYSSLGGLRVTYTLPAEDEG